MPCGCKTRTIRPMKVNKYSNTFQMHEQRGSYQLVDTCDVTSVEYFIFNFILDEAESRTIVNRPDTNALLTQLANETFLSAMLSMQGDYEQKSCIKLLHFFNLIIIEQLICHLKMQGRHKRK